MGMFCGYGEDDYSLAWAAWSSVGRLSWSDSTMWSFKERGAGKITWALGQHLASDPGTDYRLGRHGEQQIQTRGANSMLRDAKKGKLATHSRPTPTGGCRRGNRVLCWY